MAAATVLPSSSPPNTFQDRRLSGISLSRSSAVSSSATSFRTAPGSSPATNASTSSASLDTLGPEAHIQGVHLVKVSGDGGVEMDSASGESFFKKGSLQPIVVSSTGKTVGPPPPSPPASFENSQRELDDEVDDDMVAEDGLEKTPRRRRPSASSSQRIAPIRSITIGPVPSTPDGQTTHFPRGSSDARSSMSTIRTPRVATGPSAPAGGDTSSIDSVPTVQIHPAESTGPRPADFLQPPPISMHNHRPTRRNTTGSSAFRLPSRTSLQGTSQSSSAFDDAVADDVASDIQAHADLIRRERQEKRAQAQAEAEAALTKGQPEKGVDVPLVGNLIGEDHENYVLMYNMLTGIRTAVSRCQAKMTRPLTDEDFQARHKFSFDIVGNELTPSAKYDFKFKDYAPWVFRSLREEYFHLDPADYLLSLTSKYILSELGSPGKSGSFFYFSRDYRFIIKTIHHNEHKFLLKVLKQYYEHVKTNPHTLLSRFYGLHRVKLPHGRKIHFVIMNNLFPPHKDVHETYDLKGSTVGREFPESIIQSEGIGGKVLKDMNWINRHNEIGLGPEKRALLTEQLRRDKELLKQIQVMDYSLLIGIHHMKRGNKDNMRSHTLKVFDPNLPRRYGTAAPKAGSKSPEAIAMRKAMRASEARKITHEGLLPENLDSASDRQNYIFYQDEGGLRATSESNEDLDTIYYLGVIDILTPWTVKKRAENIWKGLSADKHKISPVPPAEYGDRFFEFMKAVMRGGGGGDAFKP